MVEQMELGVVDEKFKTLSTEISDQDIYQMINELNDISNSLRYTAHPDVYLEVLTVKITHLDEQTAVASRPAPQPVQNAPEIDSRIEKLTTQVAQLQQEIEQLRKTPATGSESPSVPAVAASKSVEAKPVNAHVEIAKIYPILGSATRQQLNQFKEVWPDLMNSLSVTQRAVMHVSKPVAASADGVIVAFDYSFLYQKAQGDTELKDALGNNLDRIVGKAPQIVFVPENQWPDIRSEYLKNHKDQIAGGGKQEADDPDPKAHPSDDGNKNPVVKKAEELFGKEILDIKND